MVSIFLFSTRTRRAAGVEPGVTWLGNGLHNRKKPICNPLKFSGEIQVSREGYRCAAHGPHMSPRPRGCFRSGRPLIGASGLHQKTACAEHRRSVWGIVDFGQTAYSAAGSAVLAFFLDGLTSAATSTTASAAGSVAGSAVSCWRSTHSMMAMGAESLMRGPSLVIRQ